MTEEQISQIRGAYRSGTMDLLKGFAEKQIYDLRSGRVRKENNEETLWNLAETIGGEKALLQFFNSLYDLCHEKG